MQIFADRTCGVVMRSGTSLCVSVCLHVTVGRNDLGLRNLTLVTR